jgi:hypothetical protein
MSCYISVKNKTAEYEHFEVPKEVYIYIRQLESYIKYPELSDLKRLYPERFGIEQEMGVECS